MFPQSKYCTNLHTKFPQKKYAWSIFSFCIYSTIITYYKNVKSLFYVDLVHYFINIILIENVTIFNIDIVICDIFVVIY